VFRPFKHGDVERGHVGKLAVMAVKILPRPFGHGATHTPAAGQKVLAVAGRNHRISVIPDQRDGHAVGADAE
jgi:hypothetical protein